MNVLPVRIVFFIMLLISLLSLSGLTATASAMIHAEAATACCDQEGDESEKGALPCQLPDCSCLSCMAIELVTLTNLPGTTLIETFYHVAAQQLHLSTYISSIEYPPETA